MLSQHFKEIRLSTQGRGLYEVTSKLEQIVTDSGLRDGLLTAHLRHTSASLLIQENADPGVRRDLERFFTRLAPDGDAIFEHTAEGPDDMPAHVRTALTAVNLSLPFRDAELALGVWQGVYVWEHRRAGHTRSIAVCLLGE